MNLLPKSHKEFGETEYWNRFFKQRGKNNFEWYGEYLELAELLHKYVKISDEVLMVGCGNSSLSASLYDAGIRKMTNIDISPVVIKQMKSLHAGPRPGMEFLHMDATEMTFEDGKFSVVLDKGTLDALMTDSSADTLALVQKYWSEVIRTLRLGGRYICISLLQQHILEAVVRHFVGQDFILRVNRCHEAEQKSAENSKDGTAMPVFMVIATKFKPMPKRLLEVALSVDVAAIQRVESEEEFIEAIRSAQKAAMVVSGLHRMSIADQNEVSLDLYRPGDPNPRYTIYVLDQKGHGGGRYAPFIVPQGRESEWLFLTPEGRRRLNEVSLDLYRPGDPNPRYTISVLDQKGHGGGRYASFIVPQGRESEWLFFTPEGRRRLLNTVRYRRLSIVTMHRGQDYESWDAVKDELSASVQNLAPADLKADEIIPYLSLGGELGAREIIHEGKSPCSGDFIIEDVAGEGNEILRKLIFLSNQFVVQSEAQVKLVKRGKKEMKVIDKSYLGCQHHLFMTMGVQMCQKLSSRTKMAKKKPLEVLLIGLGGGGLCLFMQQCIKNCRITAVEIDPEMLVVATKFFGLEESENIKVVIDDGLNFLKESKVKYDAILFDVDGKDSTVGMSCPPVDFVSEQTLKCVKEGVGEKGLFILNLVCRDESGLRETIVKRLKGVFKGVCRYKLEMDLNEIIYCSNEEISGDTLRETAREVSKEMKRISVKKKLEFLQDDAFSSEITLL